jgi:hypothetical protein
MQIRAEAWSMKIRIALTTLFLVAPVAPAAHAQIVRGTLLDAVTDAPIENGAVSLLDSADQTVATAIANEQGVFVLRAPGPGGFRLLGQRIGYATATSSPFAVPADDYVDVVLRLSVEPTLLEPITVIAPSWGRLTPGAVVNAERRERGQGVFLSRDEILARTDQDVRDVIRDVDGIRVGIGRSGLDCRLGRGRGTGIALWDGLCLISSKGWGCFALVINEQRMQTTFGDDRDYLAEMLPRPQNVAAMEIYRTYQEMPDFHKSLAWPVGQREPCGLVAIWTLAAW